MEKYFSSLTDTISWQEEFISFIFFSIIFNIYLIPRHLKNSKTKEKHNLSPQQNRPTTNTDISRTESTSGHWTWEETPFLTRTQGYANRDLILHWRLEKHRYQTASNVRATLLQTANGGGKQYSHCGKQPGTPQQSWGRTSLAPSRLTPNTYPTEARVHVNT